MVYIYISEVKLQRRNKKEGKEKQRLMKRQSYKDRMYTLSGVWEALGEGTVNGMMLVYVCVRAGHGE